MLWTRTDWSVHRYVRVTLAVAAVGLLVTAGVTATVTPVRHGSFTLGLSPADPDSVESGEAAATDALGPETRRLVERLANGGSLHLDWYRLTHDREPVATVTLADDRLSHGPDPRVAELRRYQYVRYDGRYYRWRLSGVTGKSGIPWLLFGAGVVLLAGALVPGRGS